MFFSAATRLLLFVKPAWYACFEVSEYIYISVYPKHINMSGILPMFCTVTPIMVIFYHAGGFSSNCCICARFSFAFKQPDPTKTNIYTWYLYIYNSICMYFP